MIRKILTIDNPELASQWDYEKNAGLRPEDFTGGSNKEVWWRCQKGHSWKAKINNRSNGNGCPYCYGRFAIQGVNDLATVHPQLASEWDYNKNGDFRPFDAKPQSNKKAWWLCANGHSWQAGIAWRTAGNGCPYCAGQLILEGFNDLATIRPELVLEWDFEKNGDIKPTNVAAASHKKVWWKCGLGHNWEAAIYHRSRGTGCPVCRGLKILTGFNDLATLYPHLIVEWDFEKNGNLNPCAVSPGSHKKVWWRGTCGHSWNAVIYDRSKGLGCPVCRGLKVVAGVNDLATLSPYIASEWNYEKNGDLLPSTVTIGADIKVWWKCFYGHSWEALIYSRNAGHGCPYCAGQLALQGVNDLNTLLPKLTSEWDYEKNGNLKPSDFKIGSGRKVWWKCARGHSWKTTVSKRNYGYGCPICSGKQPMRLRLVR